VEKASTAALMCAGWGKRAWRVRMRSGGAGVLARGARSWGVGSGYPHETSEVGATTVAQTVAARRTRLTSGTSWSAARC
jgi:hypothetical protein